MRIAVVDIGGTAIKTGIWNGTVLSEQKEWDTNAKQGGPYLIERVKEILHSYGEFEAIGVSTAGQVNTSNGTIHYANENIPNYTGMPVKEILEQEFGVPVGIENDVNAAALGELHFGAGKGLQSFLCITYGTGVGGAIVIDGKVYPGATYSGGSFGGILLHPEQMNPEVEFSGCYEKCASTTALVRKAKELDVSLENGRKIFAVIERPEVKKIVDEWIDEIVYGLVTLIHVFNPSDILLGGGILAQEYVSSEVKQRVDKKISPGFLGTKIRQTSLGNQAGMMGAVWLAEKALSTSKN